MTFLADESVDRQIVDRLRKDGHLVLYVAEMEPGMPDHAVLSLSNQRTALLVTSDKDFGELVFRQGQITSGVILVRLPGLTSEAKAQIVSSAVREHSARFANAFAAVTPSAVRIRRPRD